MPVSSFDRRSFTFRISNLFWSSILHADPNTQPTGETRFPEGCYFALAVKHTTLGRVHCNFNIKSVSNQLNKISSLSNLQSLIILDTKHAN
jgi:hypothetical protein